VYEIIRLSLVRESHDGAGALERSSQHGLKQRMCSNLDDDGVVWNMLKSFLEQHRTEDIVDMVFGR